MVFDATPAEKGEKYLRVGLSLAEHYKSVDPDPVIPDTNNDNKSFEEKI
jgi:hypothetical protein